MTSDRDTASSRPAWYVDRRNFLKTGAFLGGSALLASQLQSAMGTMAAEAQEGAAYPLANPENILYSVCLQCNTGCGIKAKILDGVCVKIDGNPLDPMNLTPHLAYASSPVDLATYDAILCPKGQAGIQSVYDPYRIVKVLKRAGKRGAGEWKTIPFDQAIREIVDGGPLFKDVAGEESRQVAGLKELCGPCAIRSSPRRSPRMPRRSRTRR